MVLAHTGEASMRRSQCRSNNARNAGDSTPAPASAANGLAPVLPGWFGGVDAEPFEPPHAETGTSEARRIAASAGLSMASVYLGAALSATLAGP